MIQVLLSRDSVAAGDDADAPHEKTLTVPKSASVEAIVLTVIQSGYLPSIMGGKATWSANSTIPLAVVAQEWDAPRMIRYYAPLSDKLDKRADSLRLHFTYYAQLDPHIVFETLQRYSAQL